MRETKFDVGQYCHQDLFTFSQINHPEILLLSMSNAHVSLFLNPSTRNGFNHKRRTLSVKSAATANISGTCDGAPSGTSQVLDKVACVALLDRRCCFQALGDLQNTENLAWVEALLMVRFVTRQHGYSVVEPEAVKLSNLANGVTDIVRHDSLHYSSSKVRNKLQRCTREEHGVLILAAKIVGIVVT